MTTHIAWRSHLLLCAALSVFAGCASRGSTALAGSSTASIEASGQCGYYEPEGAKPASVRLARGARGQLRVTSSNDLGTRLPVGYKLSVARDTAVIVQTQSDTGLTMLGLSAGHYTLHARSIAHFPLSTTFAFGPDTGVVATLRLARGGNLCEDGLRERRRPWWRIW